MLPKLVTLTENRPTYATEFDACCDIQATVEMYIMKGSRALVPTGLKFEPLGFWQRWLLNLLPFRFMLRLLPRSGAAVKGVDIGAGVVDVQYTKEIFVLIINNTNDTLRIRPGDRIAQATWLVGLRVSGAVVNKCDRIGGFGSSNGG